MIYQKDNYYHVYNRGCNKGNIFHDKSDYINLITKMKLTKEKYSVEIIAYCLMPNHYHLLLFHMSDKPVSDWIRDIFNGYVQRFNRMYDRSGYLFEKSAKPKLIIDEKYLIDVVHYIHANPIKHGLANNAKTWEYSSCLEYQNHKSKVISNRVMYNYFHTGWTYSESFLEYLESRKFNEFKLL